MDVVITKRLPGIEISIIGFIMAIMWPFLNLLLVHPLPFLRYTLHFKPTFLNL